LEKQPDQQAGSESKTQLVEKINLCLRSGDYSRALDLLKGAAGEFPNDAELSELEKLAQDGVRRKAEADRLITESQERFAQQKSGEAIQLLREAYELDKNNARARAILANALVEHAISLVETDWWESATLAKQALDLNPAHPTAKTIRTLIRDQKKAGSVEDWCSQVSKHQSSGDLLAALSLIAEGLTVHPRDPKLLLLQDAVQRDQDARRRQARRRDLEDLRRMGTEIEGADAASKEVLAKRLRAVVHTYLTDGEILSVANSLLDRLGSLEVPQQNSATSLDSEGTAAIQETVLPSIPEASHADNSRVSPSQIPPNHTSPASISGSRIAPEAASSQATPSAAPPVKVAIPAPEPVSAPVRAVTIPVAAASEPAKFAPSVSDPQPPTGSNSTTLILASAAAIILVAATFFFTRKYYAQPTTKTPSSTPTVPAPAASAPPASAPTVAPPGVSAPAPTTSQLPAPASAVSSGTAAGTATTDHQRLEDQPPAESGHNLGTIVVVAGQDDASVFLNGKLQPQLTQSGQLRLPNLELKDYVVQVSKNGFQDPPQQRIRLRQGEQTRLVFHLEPQHVQPQSIQSQSRQSQNQQPAKLQAQPRLASLTIQGGAPGTAVFVDQTQVGAIQGDGTLSVSTVNPGDHTVELRKDRFKPRQFKKHFVVGGTIALAAADAALEAVPGELKITFTPADANVAIVKGDLLKIVSSGVPLTLPPGTYTLTARTAERLTRSSTLEVVAGQSKALDLSLAPNGMSKWDDPAAWKHEGDSFIRKGGEFVTYGVAPASGTFVFSGMLIKGHVLQWVVNYTDPKNYVLFQMDDNNFYRAVIRNGTKTDVITVPDKSDKKSLRALQIRVSPTEIVHQIKHGERWTVLDRWTQPGANLSQGKFGFYIPGNDQVALSSFAHYVDLNIR